MTITEAPRSVITIGVGADAALLHTERMQPLEAV